MDKTCTTAIDWFFFQQWMINPLHCYNKLLNGLLSEFSANALVMNDDCQTALDVARAKGHSRVVRVIEVLVNVCSIM